MSLIESEVASYLKYKYNSDHLIIISLLEKILAFRAVLFLWVIRASEECQLFYDPHQLKDGSLPCFQQGKGRVWRSTHRPWSISTHLFWRSFCWF